MKWINLADAIGTGIFFFWAIPVRGLVFLSVKESLLWWIAVDVYYELRPFLLPYIAFDTVADVVQRDSVWVYAADVFGIFVWSWLVKNDPPDPRDRWGSEGRR